MKDLRRVIAVTLIGSNTAASQVVVTVTKSINTGTCTPVTGSSSGGLGDKGNPISRYMVIHIQALNG